ncbi:hypothetical protein CS022_07790 [Veronia nyctiphanis]|uniref:Probable membrane transporter protein n=1 Tax=Veronia nyctiphanis TaxID=1278244 RepID=A0A4Q0YSI4_9GAMM|nr:sulfite exporter TauE/SafE family protein [Veronia nyctiphanis]RXJ73645.1 hypothetical protein CS022_07790 [Veronia nyctiphanis]
MTTEIFDYLFVALLLSIGAFIQSLVGFGLAIVVAPVLLIIDSSHVPSTITVVALYLGLINAWQYRGHLSLGGLTWAFLGRVPGSILGGVVLTVFSLTVIEITLALLVLFSVMISLSKVSVRPSNPNMLIAGFFSGLMGTTTSVGGPPMALVLQNAKAHQLRANLAIYLTVSCLLSLCVLAYTGHFNVRHLQYGLFSLPFVLISTVIAYKVADSINPAWMKKGVLVLCTLAAIGLLSHALSA